MVLTIPILSIVSYILLYLLTTNLNQQYTTNFPNNFTFEFLLDIQHHLLYDFHKYHHCVFSKQ